MNLVLCICTLALTATCLRMLRENANLKTQLLNHKICYDLESRGGNISKEYPLEVSPPIPRMLQ